MKKIAFSFSILAVAALGFIGCKKEKNVEPQPDLELQSSIDVSYGMQMISDIDVITGFMGENQLYPKFFVPSANSTGTLVPTRDTVAKFVIESFQQTTCVDGHVRDGSIFMNYKQDIVNTSYYRDYGFRGVITLSNYKVDGWKITCLPTIEGNPATATISVENAVTPVNYKPNETNLSWKIAGNVRLQHPTDSTKDMRIQFDLVKTLVNTGTPTVFPVNKQGAINWPLAIIAYKGTVVGETSRNVPFKLKIDEARQLTRDFACSPDKVYGIAVSPTSSSVTPRTEEYHPFTAGVASFSTAALYPRYIYYGSEDVSAPTACDNSGAVAIKGISYPIDFKKVYK